MLFHIMSSPLAITTKFIRRGAAPNVLVGCMVGAAPNVLVGCMVGAAPNVLVGCSFLHALVVPYI